MSSFKIVKSNPGYYALDRMCWEKEDRIDAVKVPVIAWRITLTGNDAEILPICVDALSDLWEEEILAPDGIVYQRGNRIWNSFDEFKKHVSKKKAPDANHIETTIMDKLSEVASI